VANVREPVASVWSTYDHYLREEFKLYQLEEVLELSRDCLTAKGLKSINTPRSLPRWNGVKYLTPNDNTHFQERAAELALESESAREHLANYIWLDRD
jgi:hypothetical protein